MRILLSSLSGVIFSIVFWERLRTIRLLQSASASTFEMACPGRTTAKMTSGENLLVSVLSKGIDILPPKSYLSLRYCDKSLNF